jgi:hypothetical protein
VVFLYSKVKSSQTPKGSPFLIFLIIFFSYSLGV